MSQFSAGTKLGGYEIIGLIGKGGMGEVYSATDMKLGRSVAIKVLPEIFTHDPDRVSRFKREAKVLAALNHTNIAVIHGLEESADQQFLVMEFVEGETLADKLARGALTIDEGLRIALQVAEALEAAHDKSIVHRDLKPANVKITPDGKVKVLDFGLAKAFDAEGSSAALSNSPTLTGNATNAGVILGTAAYMSPEQAKGFTADPRSDVFSFGCMLFEMLTGKAAFDGDSVSDIIASVLKTEPHFDALPQNLDPRFRRLLHRTLAKNPKRRFHAIADVRFEIEDILSGTPAAFTEAKPSRTSRAAWVLAGVATFTFAVTAFFQFRSSSAPEPAELRLEITTPATGAPLEFALSPDGRYIVFVASDKGPQRLWLRSLDRTDSRPLLGTEGAGNPFWSGDSRSIGFTAVGKVKRVDIAGAPPQVLATASTLRSGAWNADGTILFNAVLGALSRISASGGEPVTVTKLDPPRQAAHINPRFLPDGRHFLFYAIGTEAGVYLGSLDGGEPKRLTAAESAAEYLDPGMIVFVRQTTLMAQKLDLERGELMGEPIRVADPVGYSALGIGGFSASAGVGLAYRTGGGAERQLKWYDRTGKVLGTAAEPDSGTSLYPELSPDQRSVAVTRTVQNNTDVWLMDLIRGSMSRVSFDVSIDGTAVWSPDGRQIAFFSSRSGTNNIYVKPSSLASPEELLLETPNNKYPQDWSKDGFLLYVEVDAKNGRDLLAVPAAGKDRKPVVVANTMAEESNGQFSSDGRWVAYETNESGRSEIVLQSFPVTGGKIQISTGGGTYPRWRADGKEIYFVSPDGDMMAASITIQGGTVTAGKPIALFPALLAPGAGANRPQYAVSRDGRFLLNQPAEATATSPIVLLLNWKPERAK